MSTAVRTVILDTVVAFLDTCPELEDAEIHFGNRGDVASYDDTEAEFLEVEVGGTKYIVTAQRVEE